MMEDFYKHMIEDSPLGYAYQKVVYDDLGIPVDYIFLEANPAFENYTGLSISDIIGRSVKEVSPGIKNDSFDWVKRYGELALHGGSIEFQQYSENLHRLFSVKAYSLEKGYFIVRLSEMQNEVSLLSDLKKLVILADRWLSETEGDIAYRLETESLKNLVDAKYSILYLFDENGQEYLRQAISEDNMIFAQIEKKFGIDIIKDIKDFGVQHPLILETGMTRVYSSISEFYKDRALTALLKQVEKELGIGDVVFVSIGTSSKILGFFIHFMPMEKRFKKHQISEIHARQFGLAIAQNTSWRLLQKELNFSKALFESLPGYLYVYNEKSQLIRWNKAHEEMTGYSSDELFGKTMEDWFENEDLQRVLVAVKKVFATGSGVVEAPLRRKDGSKVWVRSSGVPFSTEGNNYFVGIGIDLTENKKKEEALKQSEQQFRKAIEEAPVPILLHAEDGEVLGISRAWLELTGYSKQEIPTISAWTQKAYGDGATQVGKLIQNLYSLEERQYNGCFSIRTKEGKSLEWDFYSTALGKMQDGRKILISVGVDSTERIGLELALKDERNLLKTTLLSVGDGIISTDLYGAIVYMNKVAEELTGWSQEEASGKPFQQVFSCRNELTDLPSDNIVKKVISSRKIQEIANHTILISKSGINWPIEDSAAPIVREDGKVIGVVLVFRDVTEKRKKNEEILFLSYHDHLSGLYNRRYFDDCIDRIDREGQVPVSLLMADINGLKLMNDAFGYKAGDELLMKISTILKQECPDMGIPIRVGGDEFVLLLPGVQKSEAEELMNRIKKLTAESRYRNMALSISIGIGCKLDASQNLRKIYQDAESDMYKHKLYESLSFRSKSIGLITSALFEKSKREMAHSQRVGELCKVIAKKMNFSDERVNRMQIAGLMHDIGKIGVSEVILNKPQALNDLEWEKMKKHPEIGYRILLSTQEYSEVADFILAHHERWDGGGYPRGLAKNEIPLEARIISVADSFDAMTTKRTYKNGLDRDEAIVEMQRCAGTQFDPQVVEIFIAYLLGT
ncbi:PAS domain S-box protein [uncultured Sphaerochaeta sp.]|uniref:PAS domain S-box protein n=1 Tax=uncultured Sphaerochaeta sp. TaxID=886478 RepID=UPI002A0A6161|nr:PAS domain S-box protein [uncultured Sphaerochaeta sp.]